MKITEPDALNRKNGVILVEPAAGLCNRLRALVSALIVAECMGRRTVLLWRSRKSCGCFFPDLFQPSPLFDVIPASYMKIADWLRISPFNNVDLSNSFVIDPEELQQRKHVIDISSLALHPVIYFRECYSDFIPNRISSEQYEERVQFYLNQLVPSASIARKLIPLPELTIGVHIRRTDHRPAIEKSRLEDFIIMMKTCLQQQPRSSFFLATDDPETELTLKATFPGKIITFPKSSYSRSNATAIREALVDLLLLSRCEKILGSYYSSFSDYASMFRRVELYKVGVGVWKGPSYDISLRA